MSIFHGAFDNSYVIGGSNFAPAEPNKKLDIKTLYDEKIKEYSDIEYLRNVTNDIKDVDKIRIILDSRNDTTSQLERIGGSIREKEALKQKIDDSASIVKNSLRDLFKTEQTPEELIRQRDILSYLSSIQNKNILDIDNELNVLYREKEIMEERLSATDGLDEIIESLISKESVQRRYQCKICYDKHVNRVLKCGHVFCSRCIDTQKKCPMCDIAINKVEVSKIYNI